MSNCKMKKAYFAPEVKVVKILKQALLAGSLDPASQYESEFGEEENVG